MNVRMNHAYVMIAEQKYIARKLIGWFHGMWKVDKIVVGGTC